jgi:hypothetical protein
MLFAQVLTDSKVFVFANNEFDIIKYLLKEKVSFAGIMATEFCGHQKCTQDTINEIHSDHKDAVIINLTELELTIPQPVYEETVSWPSLGVNERGEMIPV